MLNQRKLAQFFVKNYDWGLLKDQKEIEGKDTIFYLLKLLTFIS
jgi:hypothetical protein